MTTTKKTKSTKTQNNDVKQLIERIDVPLIQTKHLTQLFGFNDGGKFIRRHLRKHFTDMHLWGDAWTWKPDDKQLIEIVEYFTETVGVFNETKRLTVSSLNNEHKIPDKIK